MTNRMTPLLASARSRDYLRTTSSSCQTKRKMCRHYKDLELFCHRLHNPRHPVHSPIKRSTSPALVTSHVPVLVDPTNTRRPSRPLRTAPTVMSSSGPAEKARRPPHKDKKKPNKLILCFDGTGNQFTGSNGDTNVVKLLNKLDRNHPQQYHYYQSKSLS